LFAVPARFLKALVLISLPLQLLLVELLSSRPHLVEEFYTRQVYQHISRFLRTLFGWVPVPVGQLLFYTIIGALLAVLGRELARLVRRQVSFRQFLGQVGFGTVAFLSGFYFLFNVMWGLNYHRRPPRDRAD
jgi:hypothetical protein